ncbi:MAG: homocysteine S-methyltransferase family protein [candidate division WOR-3 bacterium]
MEFLGLPAPLLADGGIGEYLYSLGFPREYLASEALVRAPELLTRIHAEYVRAGAQVITTNTFDANAEKMDRHGLAHRCREINALAASVARESGALRVAGSIGPPDPGLSYAFAPRDPSRLAESYLPQIEGLLEGGVDLILLETQVDPRHTAQLFSLVRSLSPDVPVAASFTFGLDLLTPAGFSVDDVIKSLTGLELAGLGANHGISPLQFLDIYRQLLAASPFPILLEPNSGLARFQDGSFVYPATPTHFARCMASCTGPKTVLLGGCCGTTPEFISALYDQLSSGTSKAVSVGWVTPENEAEASAVVSSPPRLAESLSAGNALVVELLPPRDGDPSTFLKKAETLREFEPLAISIPDSPMGRVRASPSLMGTLLRERLGLESLVHFALRDRSLTRVQSDLLGLSAAGLHTVFVVAGDPPTLGDYPQATAIYDLSTEETLSLIGRLCLGRDLAGREIGKGSYFFPGSAISLSDPKAKDKVNRRWELGCRFFITQPVYSSDDIEPWQDVLREYPVIIALMPMRNRSNALYLASEVPGISVPRKILEKIESLDDADVPRFSLDVLSEVMEAIRGLARGVYISGPASGTEELARLWKRGL